jgi:signal peptidase I
MTSTLLVGLVFIGTLIFSLALWGYFLSLGLRWAKAKDVSLIRIAVVTLVVPVLDLAITAVSYSFVSDDALGILIAIRLVTTVVMPCIIIGGMFRLSLLRSLQAWVVALVSQVLMTLFAFLVLRPYLVETFVIPTNSMAPTILGRHWQGKCTKCGEPAFCSPSLDFTGSPQMICSRFHVSQPQNFDRRVHQGDRIVAAKFLRPDRWDIVVFRFPENPSVLFAKRLVGLPGETIEIRDGCVLANGKKLTPPPSVQGIEYLSEVEIYRGTVWGSASHPAKLGKDEYFVLGDFSAQARDSRLWERGAAGHSPYAVPASNMVGVVTNIYWPNSRLCAFR